MNIFFGKISSKFDTNQIKEGYYKAPKGSKLFGSENEIIDINDYVYIIGGNKIQLWKARGWSPQEDRLWFDIIIEDLKINTKKFMALNLFKLNKSLIVMTSRSSRNKAFFKLTLTKNITLNDINNISFYDNSKNYRKIKIFNSFNEINNDSEDIQLYFDSNSKLKLYESSFFYPDVISLFRDNLKYYNKGSKNKDNIIKKIKNKIDNLPTTFNPDEISILNLYDTFFCDYKEKSIELLIDSEIELDEETKSKQYPLNQILYGPPGTGKTYNTINKAIQIINPDFDLTKREEVKEEYERLVNEGRIVFTTFHQSMSYEDFIEGIKPQKPTDNDTFLKYDIEQGIFKEICDRARKINVELIDVNWDNHEYYKMSLGGKSRADLHEWCIENNLIALGWGGTSDLSQYKNIKNFHEYKSAFIKKFPDLVNESKFNIQSTYMFLNMKINDIVVISKGNNIIDAIGIITGDYYWSDKNPVDFFHYRPIKWIAKNMNTLPTRFLKKQISQMSIYKFSDQDIKKDNFKEITSQTESIVNKPYVLIIDEINRGNVSNIFGELITLIETDKRLGENEAIKITLPYSKEEFGVPKNLYIIGTMNTADRSVEALDTALRRRFSFIEMPPKPELLQDLCENINLVELLKTINDRLELLLDKDHTIGHSYFLNLDNINSDEELKEIFENSIIPLLQEYFYGDWGKIGLVLGDSFIEKKNLNTKFASFDYSDSDELKKDIFKFKNSSEWDFKSIYE